MKQDQVFYEDLFRPLFPVGIKRLFGGLGLYCEGRIFAIAINNTLYFKADASSTPAYEQAGGQAFAYAGKKKPVSICYWTVPDQIFEDEETLRHWTRIATDTAERSAEPMLRKKKKA